MKCGICHLVGVGTLFLMLQIERLEGALIGLSTDTNSLYRIDPSNGSAEFVVQLQGNFAGPGLAFLDGELYASNFTVHLGDPWDVRVARVNMSTGELDPLNQQDGSLNWQGLAANATENVLYSIALDQPGQLLKRSFLDSSIESVGSGTGIDGRGMAYDDNHGILYATAELDYTTVETVHSLYTVDVTTGISTRIGPMGIKTNWIGLAYDEVNDLLYANQLDASPTERIGSLYIVDVQSGEASLIGSNGDSAPFIDGLVWIPDEHLQPIPEPSSLAIFGIGGCIAGLGYTGRRRRKAA